MGCGKQVWSGEAWRWRSRNPTRPELVGHTPSGASRHLPQQAGEGSAGRFEMCESHSPQELAPGRAQARPGWRRRPRPTAPPKQTVRNRAGGPLRRRRPCFDRPRRPNRRPYQGGQRHPLRRRLAAGAGRPVGGRPRGLRPFPRPLPGDRGGAARAGRADRVPPLRFRRRLRPRARGPRRPRLPRRLGNPRSAPRRPDDPRAAGRVRLDGGDGSRGLLASGASPIFPAGRSASIRAPPRTEPSRPGWRPIGSTSPACP